MLRDMFSCELTPFPTFSSPLLYYQLIILQVLTCINMGNPYRTINAQDFLQKHITPTNALEKENFAKKTCPFQVKKHCTQQVWQLSSFQHSHKHTSLEICMPLLVLLPYLGICIVAKTTCLTFCTCATTPLHVVALLCIATKSNKW